MSSKAQQDALQLTVAAFKRQRVALTAQLFTMYARLQ